MKTDNVFKVHPALKKYHKTSDGTAFFQETDAKNHAKNLEDKTVETIVNEAITEVVVEDETAEAAKKPVATKKKASSKKKAAVKTPAAPKAPEGETQKKEEPKQD